MRNAVLFSILILLLAGCNKDKFNTKPSLKYESVNRTIIGRNEGNIVFTLSFTDAEGDLTDSLTIVKSTTPCASDPTGGFVAPYPLPAFPAGKNQSGDIIVTFGYNDISPKCFPKNDTAVFKFILKDKAQNISDTALSDPIVIINN